MKFVLKILMLTFLYASSVCAGDSLIKKFAQLNISSARSITICHETQQQEFIAGGITFRIPLQEKPNYVGSARNASVIACTKENPVCSECKKR